MQTKTAIFVMALIVFNFSARSQVKEHLDKLAKDPKMKENAARADVFIIKNDSIFNPSTLNPIKPVSKELPPKKKKDQSNKN